LQFAHRVVGIEDRQHGGADEAPGPGHELVVEPVVVDLATGQLQLSVVGQVHPQRARREDQFGPDALLVQIGQPLHRILGAGRADRVHERDRVAAHHLRVDVDDLAVVDRLDDRAAIAHRGRQLALPQVERFENVRIGRVDPLSDHRCPLAGNALLSQYQLA
jgi:hypothetical protein